MKHFDLYRRAAAPLAVAFSMAVLLSACSGSEETTSMVETTETTTTTEVAIAEESAVSTEAVENEQEERAEAVASVSGETILDTTDLFTQRDLEQEADLTEAITYTVSDGEDLVIEDEGVYILTGSAENVTVYVNAEDTDKVQLVLDGVEITNDSLPCICVLQADKVFVTTAGDSTLQVTGTFETVDSYETDAVIWSRSDLVLNGTATLTIASTDAGVDCKDDLKVTGGTYVIMAETKALDANDSIRICDGSFTLQAGTDGLHAENNDDDSKGYIYISGGTFAIEAGDDGIHGTSVIQIDGGEFTISAVEGIEATYVQINGGVISVEATDDGINASAKSTAYSVTIEITGGELTIVMGSGDTDGLDANGDLIISGGTIDITCNSPFDYDSNGTYTGGTLIVNGEQVTELTQMMMGGMGQMGGGQIPGGMADGQTPGEAPEGAMDQGTQGNMPGGGQPGNRGGNGPRGMGGDTVNG